MPKQTMWFIILAALVVIGLCTANIYLSIKSSNDVPRQIKRSLEEYRIHDTALTNKLIDTAVTRMVPATVVGEKGDTGAPGPKGEAIVGPQGPAGQAGKDAVAKDGANGKDARSVVMDADPETGDIMWRYEDDTLWTLLIEGCVLKNTCEAPE